MTVSSRTPEGQPNKCPVCAAQIRIEPSLPWGDAPCPSCGHLLWFVKHPNGHQFHNEQTANIRKTELRHFIARQLGISVEKIPHKLNEIDFNLLGADSLDAVEIIMMLEEEFHIYHN